MKPDEAKIGHGGNYSLIPDFAFDLLSHFSPFSFFPSLPPPRFARCVSQVSVLINTCPLSPHLITGVWELGFPRLSQILMVISDSSPSFYEILGVFLSAFGGKGEGEVGRASETPSNVATTVFRSVGGKRGN